MYTVQGEIAVQRNENGSILLHMDIVHASEEGEAGAMRGDGSDTEQAEAPSSLHLRELAREMKYPPSFGWVTCEMSAGEARVFAMRILVAAVG
jgi:hypothetical protein